jgi:hypothetical protein
MNKKDQRLFSAFKIIQLKKYSENREIGHLSS